MERKIDGRILELAKANSSIGRNIELLKGGLRTFVGAGVAIDAAAGISVIFISLALFNLHRGIKHLNRKNDFGNARR